TVPPLRHRYPEAGDGPGRDVLGLARAPVEAMYAAVGVPAVDDVGIERVGRDVAALARAHRRPVAEGERPEVAATRHPGGPRILLGAVDTVGEGVVRNHVVELSRGLVVRAASGADAVGGEHRDGMRTRLICRTQIFTFSEL